MSSHLAGYGAVLQAEGPAGLAYLNARVPHRYTAVYRIHGGELRNLYLHDKLGQARPEFLAVVPLEDSFCQFVLRDGVFLSEDSAQDRRLDGHKYQGAVVSYHGVPLLDDRSELFGTLCHFDVTSHGLDDAELAYLKQAARILPRFLRDR